LLASWILRPAPFAPALFAALAGVAVARALEALGGANASLKWPNDVELGGRKVAGALAHGSSDGGGGALVIGIGINVHQRDFPKDIAPYATSLALAGFPVDRLALLAWVTRELDRLELPDARDGAMGEWRDRSTLLGKGVTVASAGREFSGTATAIDDEGALLVHTSDGVERVVTGDVRLST
jgi:BirA family biotin operon repressor/biotin-[acetyl-CoA-carboxylase] ligase